jgi:hypothetical protein
MGEDYESQSSFLLFPSDVRIQRWSSRDEQTFQAKYWRDSLLLDDRAGLYLTPTGNAAFGDAVDLLTPWPVHGSNLGLLAYVEHCPFFAKHDVRLFSVVGLFNNLALGNGE